MSCFGVFVVLLFCLLVAGKCPGNCNGHGDCVIDHCSCNSGWSGDACDIPTIPLSGNGVLTQTYNVDAYKWIFFETQVRASSGLSYFVNSTTGDCDFYLQVNALPSRASYVARDITLNKAFNVTLSSSVTVAGTYFAGLYGYSACSFRLSLVSSSCPNACSGHGTCSNGACACAQGFAGADCSVVVPILAFSTPASGSVAPMAWTYFYTPRSMITADAALTYTLTEAASGVHDCDIFLQYDEAPTYEGYIAANTTSISPSSITYVVPGEESFSALYFGVYGWSGCSFSVVLTAQSGQCEQTQCSKHGQCVGGVSCACSSGFTGDDCEYMSRPLSAGAAVAGYVDDQAWNYYTILDYSQDEIVVTVQETAVAGDCDIYVKAEEDPTRVDFDYYNLSLAQSSSIRIQSEYGTTWHVGVYGWGACDYEISFETSTTCDPDCVHGSCSSYGTCLCDDGWAGLACEVAVTPLVNGAVTNGSVQAGSWNYYSFALNGSSLEVHLRENSGVNSHPGLVWLYVAQEIVPTLYYHDQANTDTHKKTHWIDMDFNYQWDRAMYIGVYGSPLGMANESTLLTTPYSIVAWQPDF